MNILVAVGNIASKGGTERASINLANAFCASSKVALFSLIDNQGKPGFDIDDGIVMYGLDNAYSIHTRPGGIGGRIADVLFLIKNYWKIREVIKQFSAEYVITTDIKLTLVMYLCSIGLPCCKVVVVEHFDYYFYSRLLMLVRKLLYPWIHRVVLLNDAYIARYPRNNSVVIPNIAPAVSTAAYSLSSRTIVAVGYLTPVKGFDLLIDAWGRICFKYPSWNLEIWGEGPEKEVLASLIDACGCKNVQLKGYSATIEDVYRNAGMLVVSSRSEGFSLVIVEAMSYGVPVVSFDCPAGPAKLIENGRNGTLVANGNIESLAEAMQELMVSDELRMRYSKNGVSCAQQFTADNIAKRWYSLVFV